MENKTLKIIRFFAAVVHLAGLVSLVSGFGNIFILPVLAWSGLLSPRLLPHVIRTPLLGRNNRSFQTPLSESERFPSCL